MNHDIFTVFPPELQTHFLETTDLTSLERPWQLLDAMLTVLDSDAFLEYIKMMNDQYPERHACIHPSVEIIHPEAVYIGEGVTIGSGAKIWGPAYIADGSIIGTPIGGYGDVVSDALIGKAIIGAQSKVKQRMYVNRSVVGESCALNEIELKDTVMGHRSSMHGGRINDSLIGDNVSMSTTQTANYANGNMILSGGVPTNKSRLGAIIGSDSVLRMDTITMPGVIIGKGCTVDNQARVTENIPDRHFLQVVQTTQLLEKPKRNK